MKIQFKITVFLSSVFVSVVSLAASDAEKVVRLENTVEQLASQLATAVEENKRLSSALREALSAQRSGARVVSGCDLEALRKKVAYGTYVGAEIDSWVRINGEACTRVQLRGIKREYQADIYSGTSRVIDYLLNN